jgi:DNA (cytosine-5)-methyltransferase 1
LPDHDILIASPCCQGHSNAKGADDAKYDASRATLLAVTSACHAKRPKVIIVENVVEVKRWGNNGDGSRYRWWLDGFRCEGYRVTENVLEAADFGNGSRRERLFIVMVHESVSAVPVAVENPHKDWVPASDVIDRTGKYDHLMTPIADKCAKTRTKYERQWEKGMPKDGEWVFCYRGKGYGYTMDETICTITRVAQWCYVKGNKSRFLQPDELRRAMGFPDGYVMPKDVKTAIGFLGNAVSVPVAQAVVETAMDAITASETKALAA